MNRHFAFTWYKNTKFGAPLMRNNSITVVNAPTDNGAAAHTATNLFCREFGNLKRNTIIRIQEYNSDGPVGEPIIPDDNNSIIPSAK